MKHRIILACFAAVSMLSAAAHAQTYPTKPIRIVVPFPAGGTVDFFARTIAPRLADAVGQTVLIENRSGAGGNIAAEHVARAAADGYTLLMGSEIVSINITLYDKLGYHPLKDLDPVILVGTVPNILITTPSLPAKDTAELIELAKSRQMTYASTGLGTSSQLSSELFKAMAGVDLLHVPYKGGAPAIVDLAGGQVDMMFINMPTGMPMVRGGKVKVLAVSGPQRAAQLPDVPTVAESGVPGFETSAWSALYAPAGTPKPVIERLNVEMAKILKMPEVQAQMAEQGAVAAGGTPQALGDFTRSEIDKWADIIKAAGARL